MFEAATLYVNDEQLAVIGCVQKQQKVVFRESALDSYRSWLLEAIFREHKICCLKSFRLDDRHIH